MTDRRPGLTWPRAKVDAPDAYWLACQARLNRDDDAGSMSVLVLDQKGRVQTEYILDAIVEVESGVLAGMVDGFPFTVINGCNCGDSFSRVPKGDG